MRLVLEQIGYGILAGVLAGVLAAGIVVVAAGRGLVDHSWLQVVPLAAAGLAFGIADPIGGSGFIAAFVGGFVFGALRRRRGEVANLIEEVGEVFGAVTFIVFGAVLLGPVLGMVTWSVALYVVLSLTIVRMLPVAAAMIGTGARRPTVAFLGWFGPRGLASIVFAVLVIEEGGLPHDDLILLTTYVAIGLSVLAHGVTAAPWPTATPPGSSRIRGTRCRASRAPRWRTFAGDAPASTQASVAKSERQQGDDRETDAGGGEQAGESIGKLRPTPGCERSVHRPPADIAEPDECETEQRETDPEYDIWPVRAARQPRYEFPHADADGECGEAASPPRR